MIATNPQQERTPKIRVFGLVGYPATPIATADAALDHPAGQPSGPPTITREIPIFKGKVCCATRAKPLRIRGNQRLSLPPTCINESVREAGIFRPNGARSDWLIP